MPNTRYTELNALRTNVLLRDRVTFCLMVYAEAIKDRYEVDPNSTTVDERQWAYHVLNKPEAEMPRALNLMLANFKDSDDDTIHNADDATVQGIVDSVAEYLIQSQADF